MVDDIQSGALELAKELALAPGSDDLFVGKRLGFPLGLKLIASSSSLVLLFQVRHPLGSDPKAFKEIRYNSEARQLIEAKALEIDFDDKLIWLTLVNGLAHLEEGSTRRILDGVLESFALAGLNENPDLCHYCRRERAGDLRVINGKVAQICPQCLDERLGTSDKRVVGAHLELMPLLLVTAIGSAAGALGWSLFWVGYDKLIDWMIAGSSPIPRLVETIALLCAAGLTGAPGGWLIRKAPRYGPRLAALFATAGAALAVVLGEVLYLTWLLCHEAGVFSPATAWRLLPRVEAEVGMFHLAVKFCAAIGAIAFSYELAKPRKPAVKL